MAQQSEVSQDQHDYLAGQPYTQPLNQGVPDVKGDYFKFLRHEDVGFRHDPAENVAFLNEQNMQELEEKQRFGKWNPLRWCGLKNMNSPAARLAVVICILGTFMGAMVLIIYFFADKCPDGEYFKEKQGCIRNTTLTDTDDPPADLAKHSTNKS